MRSVGRRIVAVEGAVVVVVLVMDMVMKRRLGVIVRGRATGCGSVLLGRLHACCA